MAVADMTAGQIQRVRDITEELLELDDDILSSALRGGLEGLSQRMSLALSQKLTVLP